MILNIIASVMNPCLHVCMCAGGVSPASEELSNQCDQSANATGGWGRHLRYMHGTLYVCTGYRHRNSMQRRLAWVQSVSQAMWCRNRNYDSSVWYQNVKWTKDPDGSEPWTGRCSPDIPFRHDPGVGRSHLRLIMFPLFKTRSWMNRPVMQLLIIDMYGVK